MLQLVCWVYFNHLVNWNNGEDIFFQIATFETSMFGILSQKVNNLFE